MNPLTPLELLSIIEQSHNFESPSLREALTELEELKRDVKRYFELINSDEWMGGELENLREEIILKVGEQNE